MEGEIGSWEHQEDGHSNKEREHVNAHLLVHWEQNFEEVPLAVFVCAEQDQKCGHPPQC